MKTSYLLVAFIVLCSSCSRIYGLNEHRYLTPDEVARTGKQFGIENTLLLDSNYNSRLATTGMSDINSYVYKQPLQIWLYRGDTLVYGNVNCYAPGVFNLNWHFSSFPTNSSLSGKNLLNLKQHYSMLHPSPLEPDSQYTVFIVWSKWLGRQNSRFLNGFQREISKLQSVRVYYFNGDNIISNTGS